jgi:hypothetical protein
MRVLNRTAVTITGAKPYDDWTRARDAVFAPSKAEASAPGAAVAVGVPRTKAYGTAYLLPEFTEEIDLIEWVEENYSWLFEFQLSAWTEDESAWPQSRDLKMFREWFRIDVHSTVVDAGDDELDGQDL